MKKMFPNRMAAVDWISAWAENEGQFEVLREQLNFNYIYTGVFYVEIDPDEDLPEVILFDRRNRA